MVAGKKFLKILILVTYRKPKPLGAIWPEMTPGQLTVILSFWGWKVDTTRRHPYYRFGPIWPLKSRRFLWILPDWPGPKGGPPAWYRLEMAAYNLKIHKLFHQNPSLVCTFIDNAWKFSLPELQIWLLSLKLIISFAKRFVWWSKLQNRGDGTANQIALSPSPAFRHDKSFSWRSRTESSWMITSYYSLSPPD